MLMDLAAIFCYADEYSDKVSDDMPSLKNTVYMDMMGSQPSAYFSTNWGAEPY